MNQLQDEETTIDSEIVNELIELTPEWWHSAVLDVTYSVEEGVQKYNHVISSPEGHKDLIVPSDKLFFETRRLGILFRRFGKEWRQVKYEVNIAEDGGLNYTVDFKY